MMLSDDLTSVCLSRTLGLSREQKRPRKTKIGTAVAQVTRDSGTTFKVRRSRVNLFDGQKKHSLHQYSAVLCFALTVSAQTW